MSTQFRDTQFGHLARFLSGDKWFPHPDEVDHTLWKAAIGSQAYKLTESNQPNDIADVSEASKEEKVIQSVEQNEATKEKNAKDKEDVLLVDWYGPNDPENPQNWSSNWKLLVTFQICFLNFAVYSCSSIYVPGEQSLMGDFGVGEIPATLGLSMFTVGYGMGPMFLSPLSEVPQLGRRGIYFWTLLAFVLFQLPVGFAVDLPMFLIFRFVTGFCGSPCLSTGGATISDMYDAAHVAYGIVIWGCFGILGPVVGPIIGGLVAPATSWRWTIWVIAWLDAVVLIMFFFLMPETSAANILYRRAKRLRKLTGDDRFKALSEIDAANNTMKDELVVLGRAFTLTFSEPIVFFLDLYTSLLYGVLFIWFESFPLVFGDIYGFDTGQQGLVFLGILIGGIITLPFFLLWLKRTIAPKLNQPGFRPETILLPTFFGSAALPICLFWYGWSARPSIHWIMPIIGSAFFSVGIITLFNPVLNYLGMTYPAYSASIFAGNALFRASFGAGFPLFARQLFYKLGIGPGNSLLGGISVCFMIMPFIFYKYGGRIRKMSKNARHDV